MMKDDLIQKYIDEAQAFVVIAVPTGSEKQLCEVEPKGKTFTLEEIKKMLKMADTDYLEAVTINKDWMLLCDEDGKRKNLQSNIVATEAWNQMIRPALGHRINDYLVGNIIFMKRHLLK